VIFSTSRTFAIVKALLPRVFSRTFSRYTAALHFCFLVIFPVVLLGLRLRPLIVLVPSFLLYLPRSRLPTYQFRLIYSGGPCLVNFNPSRPGNLCSLPGAALGFPGRHDRRMVEVGSAGYCR